MYSILIADDEHELCEVLQDILATEFKAQVEIAENGQVAFDKAQKTAFDLIITDFKMPLMDGGELIQALKTTDGPSKNTTVFLISGHLESPQDGPDIIRDVLFFSKPIEMEKLIRYCKMALKGGKSQSVA